MRTSTVSLSGHWWLRSREGPTSAEQFRASFTRTARSTTRNVASRGSARLTPRRSSCTGSSRGALDGRARSGRRRVSRARCARLGIRRLRPVAAERPGGALRPRRGVLHVLRGHRPLSPAPLGRLRARLRAGCARRARGRASTPRAQLLPVLAASRLRYAAKYHGRAYTLLERAGIALGALTHATLGRGGKTVRKGHLRALQTAVTRQAYS